MSTRTVITGKVAEEGHKAFDVQFYDEDDVTVVPDSASWTLTDVNGYEYYSTTISALATPVTILVQGATQLAVLDSMLLERHLLVEWTFTSSLGSGIPSKHQIEFEIDNLTAVT